MINTLKTRLIYILTAFFCFTLAPADAAKVGLRPLPKHKWQIAKNTNSYPFVYRNIDKIYDQGAKGLAKSNTAFPEYYIPWQKNQMDRNPKTNPVVRLIKNMERDGLNVYGLKIARETCCGQSSPPGPFPRDTRIMHESDIRGIRQVIRQAHSQNILKKSSYYIFQMCRPNDTCIKEAWPIVRICDGISQELHHWNNFNVLKPIIARVAKFCVNNNNHIGVRMKYDFYYGPFKWVQHDGFQKDMFKTWLQQLWQAGMPKSNQHMQYNMNIFDHGASNRPNMPVGPESKSDTATGYIKWLMQQVDPSAK